VQWCATIERIKQPAYLLLSLCEYSGANFASSNHHISSPPPQGTGGAIIVEGRLNATSCSFKNNAAGVVRGECGSVLLLQFNMLLLPSSSIPSCTG
jgi:hypothetical protein